MGFQKFESSGCIFIMSSKESRPFSPNIAMNL